MKIILFLFYPIFLNAMEECFDARNDLDSCPRILITNESRLPVRFQLNDSGVLSHRGFLSDCEVVSLEWPESDNWKLDFQPELFGLAPFSVSFSPSGEDVQKRIMRRLFRINLSRGSTEQPIKLATEKD